MEKGNPNEILLLQEAGFTNVKWYDADLTYTYYDARLNNYKVEVRTNEKKLEWRYLGASLEEIEWYSIQINSNKPTLDMLVDENDIQNRTEAEECEEHYIASA